MSKLQRIFRKSSVPNLILFSLSDRSHHVAIENSSSQSLSITTGVPRGSVLGLLLFFSIPLPLATISKIPLSNSIFMLTILNFTSLSLALNLQSILLLYFLLLILSIPGSLLTAYLQAGQN